MTPNFFSFNFRMVYYIIFNLPFLSSVNSLIYNNPYWSIVENLLESQFKAKLMILGLTDYLNSNEIWGRLNFNKDPCFLVKIKHESLAVTAVI